MQALPPSLLHTAGLGLGVTFGPRALLHLQGPGLALERRRNPLLHGKVWTLEIWILPSAEHSVDTDRCSANIPSVGLD